MTRKSFCALVVGLIATGAGTIGCGGSESNSQTGSDNFGRGALTGGLFLDAGGNPVLGNPTAPPAGASPARGVKVELVGYKTASVGSDGAFRLENVPAGARTLRVTLNSGATKDISVTVIADATTSLVPPPVSREAAIASAKAALSIPADALICAPQHPLPSGVVLRSAEGATADATEGTTISTASWFLFVDTLPGNPFGHPTRFILVDANTGATTVQEQQFWPVLNGCQHYATAAYAPTTPDIVQPGRARATALPSMPPIPAIYGPTRAQGTGTTHAVIVKGWPRYDMKADITHVPAILGRGGIPAGTPVILEPPSADKADVLAAWKTACMNAVPGDTVFFYLSSHGSEKGYAALATDVAAPVGTPADEIYTTLADGTKVLIEHLFPSDLDADLSKCLACRVIIMIDTCYSGFWAAHFADHPALRKGQTLTVLTAADATHVSIGYSVEPTNGIYPANAGGAYTSAFLAAFNRLEAESGGNEVSLPTAHSNAIEFLKQSANEGAVAQSPQLARRLPAPGTTCDITFTPTSATVNPKDLRAFDFTVNVFGEKPADGEYQYEFSTTGTQGTLVSITNTAGGNSFRSDHPIVGYLARIDATVNKSDTITVKVYTNETSPRLVGTATSTVTMSLQEGCRVPVNISNPCATISGLPPTVVEGQTYSISVNISDADSCGGKDGSHYISIYPGGPLVNGAKPGTSNYSFTPRADSASCIASVNVDQSPFGGGTWQAASYAERKKP